MERQWAPCTQQELLGLHHCISIPTAGPWGWSMGHSSGEH